MMEIYYQMPAYGLGTDFSESERPLTFAGVYTNRFRNTTGGAERRPGMTEQAPTISGRPNLTRLHEWVGYQGQDVLFASDNNGNIWNYVTTSASTSVSAAVSAWNPCLTGKAHVRLMSSQAEDMLIFFNGVDRNFYTNDGGHTFNELKALITKGQLETGSSATAVVDGNIVNWVGQTLVSDSSIVYNVTQNGYGIVSTIASAQLTITAIGSAGVANGAGVTSTGNNQQAGDTYQLIDYVNLPVFTVAGTITNPVVTSGANATSIAILTTGSNSIVVSVSGTNFAATQARTGDFVYNTTRGAISQIATISANINLQQPIIGQIPGDTVAFFKSAMPIASWVHVHYGRVYYLDSRQQTQIVISAPDDPQDVTTFQETLDSTSFSFGTQQPSGDTIRCMSSFQQYFVAAGQRNLYIYSGTNPIADNSNSTINFNPIAFYPNGVYSRYGLGTNGTDLLHVTLEGLQSINIGSISFTTIQNNVSVPIRSEIINLIAQTSPDDVQLSFYPRRSWLIVKVGTSVYILNTNPSYDETGTQRVIPSWHLFTGLWAQQNHYYIRRNGDLLACGPNGMIYFLDPQTEVGDDDGQTIPTTLEFAWMRLEEPQRSPRIKTGHYIRPVFESSSGIGYTINVVAGWDGLSADSIVVSAVSLGGGIIGQAIIGTTPIGSGTIVQNDKYPLRWRGEQARIEISTNSNQIPDVITGLYLYGDLGGVR